MDATRFTLGLVGTLMVLVSCQPVVTDLDKSQAASSSNRFNSIQTGETKTQAMATPTITASLKNTTNQTLVLNFAQPLDASTVASALSFYTLANAADNYTAYTATALPTTPTVVVNGKQALVTLDLTTASNPIEMRIAADVLTARADDGLYRLNPNGNTLAGEAGEVFITTITVGTNSAVGATPPPAPATGVSRNPYATVTNSVAASLLSNGVKDLTTYSTNAIATSLGITWSDTGSSATADKVAVDAKAFQVYKNVDGVWTLQSGTTLTTNTANKDTIINLTPLQGDSYRIDYYPYYVVESQAVADFVHRGSYDALAKTSYYVTFASGTTAIATLPTAADSNASLTASSYPGTLFVDVTTTNDLDWTTVSTASVKLKVNSNQVQILDGDDGTTSPLDDADAFLQVTLVKQETSSGDLKDDQVKKFRIYLPPEVIDYNTTPGITGTVWFAPSVLTTATNTAAMHKLTFGDPTATANQGWRTVSF